MPTARDLLSPHVAHVPARDCPAGHRAAVDANPNLTFAVFDDGPGGAFRGLVGPLAARVAPQRPFGELAADLPAGSVPDTAPLPEIVAEMDRQGVNLLAVLDAGRRFVGLVTRARIDQWLLAGAERRRREIEVLDDLVRDINASLDLDAVLSRVVEGARELGGAREARITVGTGDGAVRYRAGEGGLPGEADLPATVSVPIPGLDGAPAGHLAVAAHPGERLAEGAPAALVRLADHAAIAIRNARLFAQSETRRRTLETLVDVGRLLAQSMDPVEVSQRIADGVRTLFHAESSILYRLEADGELAILAASGPPPPRGAAFALPRGASVSGLAVETGGPVATEDFLADPRIAIPPDLRSMLGRAPFRAALAVPLTLGDAVIGALVVADRRGRRFTDADAALLQSFADQAVLAIDNARQLAGARAAERAIRERAEEQDALLSLSRALASTLEVEPLLRQFMRGVVRVLGADTVGIWQMDAATGWLTPLSGYHVPPAVLDTLRQYRIKPEEGPLFAEGIRSRRAQVSPSAMEDAGIPASFKAAAPHRTLLFVPIVAKDRVIAAFLAAWWDQARHLDEREILLVEAMASQAGFVLENARLFHDNQRRLQEMSVLYELSREVTGEVDVARLGRAIHQHLGRLLDPRDLGLFLYDEGRREFEVVLWMVDGVPDETRPRTSPLGHGLMSLVVQRRRPVRTSDYAAACRAAGVEPAPDSARFPHWLGVPMVAGDRVVGTIGLRSVDQPFQEEDERLLLNVAGLVALAVRSARLHREGEARRRRLATLVEVTQRLTRGLELPAVLVGIAEAAALVFEGEAGFRLLEGDELVRAGATSGALPAMLRERLPVAESLGGSVVASGRALVTEDVSREAAAIPGHPGVRWPDRLGAVLAVPLRVGLGMLGVLLIFRPRGFRFEPDAVNLAQSLADQAGIALENARLYGETRRQHREAVVLAEVARELTASLDRDEVLRRIVERVRTLAAVDVAFIAPLLPETRTARISAVAGARTDALLGLTFTPGRGGGGLVLESSEPFTTEDYLGDPRISRDFADQVVKEGTVSVAVVPLRFGGAVTGLLGVHTRTRRRFSARDLALLTTVADHAAVALQNSRLYGELGAALAAAESSQQRIIRTERLRALGQMAGGVAHDFNNALAVILGRTQLLLRQVQAPGVRRQLQVVETVTLDAARTVRRIQEFARMRRARPFHPVDLGQVVQEVMEVTRTRWRDESQAGGVTHEVQLDLVPVPAVAGDAAELGEALASMVFNALDAMPAGGRLTVRTGVRDGRVTCALIDTGAGMSEEVRARVFDPFFTTKGERGSGLGLSMAYGIVNRHGGEIDVESAPGRGSTFTIRLPLSTPALPGPAGPVLPAAGSGGPPVKSRRILVIDDETEVRNVVARLLESQGHTVAAAEDGPAGLARLEGGDIDVVVTDLGMPGVSGWEVARLIRLGGAALPVVLITGWGDQIDPGEAQARGVDAVVSKPFTAADLAAALARAVAGREAGPS